MTSGIDLIFCFLPVCALVEVLPHVRFTTALATETSAAVFSAGHYSLVMAHLQVGDANAHIVRLANSLWRAGNNAARLRFHVSLCKYYRCLSTQDARSLKALISLPRTATKGTIRASGTVRGKLINAFSKRES